MELILTIKYFCLTKSKHKSSKNVSNPGNDFFFVEHLSLCYYGYSHHFHEELTAPCGRGQDGTDAELQVSRVRAARVVVR